MAFGGGGSSDIPCVGLEFSEHGVEFAVATRPTPAVGGDGRGLDIADGLHRSDVNREVPPQRYALTYQSKRGRPQLAIIVEGGISRFSNATEHGSGAVPYGEAIDW